MISAFKSSRLADLLRWTARMDGGFFQKVLGNNYFVWLYFQKWIKEVDAVCERLLTNALVCWDERYSSHAVCHPIWRTTKAANIEYPLWLASKQFLKETKVEYDTQGSRSTTAHENGYLNIIMGDGLAGQVLSKFACHDYMRYGGFDQVWRCGKPWSGFLQISIVTIITTNGIKFK